MVSEEIEDRQTHIHTHRHTEDLSEIYYRYQLFSFLHTICRVSSVVYKHRIFFITVLFIYTITFAIVLPLLCMGVPYTKYMYVDVMNPTSAAVLVRQVHALNNQRLYDSIQKLIHLNKK